MTHSQTQISKPEILLDLRLAYFTAVLLTCSHPPADNTGSGSVG